jgi:hypothetical protein
VKINNVTWTMEEARAARERARELVRQSRILIQNANTLLDQELRSSKATPSQFRQRTHAGQLDSCFD